MIKNKHITNFAGVIFAVFLIFWLVLAVKSLQGETPQAEFFSATYGLMALFGGILGLGASRRWGGYRSVVGRSVLFIALGLLAQEAGQITYSTYTYLFHQEIPYPSVGDIGYFASVIFYILGAFSLVKALSTKAVFKQTHNRFFLFIVPVILLAFSYYYFLKGYSFDVHHPLTILLDFGYPLGQAAYISLAILAFLLSKRYLGGAMKPVIFFLIFALLLQYAADFTFLYQTSRKTWQTAGYNELIYLTAYYVMTRSLMKFGAVIDRFNAKTEKK